MLVATVADSEVGRVVEVVVFDCHATTVESQAWARDARQSPTITYVAVPYDVVAARQSLTVASSDVEFFYFIGC